MTASDAAMIVRSLRTMEPYECRMIETGRGFARTIYAGCGERHGEEWWVVAPGDRGPRWSSLAETLAELGRHATEAEWLAAIPAGDPMFPD